MTTTPTLAELLAGWNLGNDNLGRNTAKVLTEAGLTPAAAARMTPAELAAIRGLGASRLDRVREQLALIVRALLDECEQLQQALADVDLKFRLGHGGAWCATCRLPMREGTPVVKTLAVVCDDCAVDLAATAGRLDPSRLAARRADLTGPQESAPTDRGSCDGCGCCSHDGCHRFADATCPTDSLGDSACPCTED